MKGYKPTLGGLQKLQEYLKENGFDLPVFQINIYKEGRRGAFGTWTHGGGESILVEDAIQLYGTKHEVTNIALASPGLEKYFLISDLGHSGSTSETEALTNGFACTIGFCPASSVDPRFAQFLELNFTKILEIARWGKPSPIRRRLFFAFR